jgi:antitoxin MazE
MVYTLFINRAMKVTAQLWGNSLGVRIPAPIARDIEIAPGSEIDLQVEAGRIVLTPTRRRRRYKLNSLVVKIAAANLPSGDTWGAPAGKEVW